MSTVNERVASLRKLMESKGLSAYIVPTADFHQSEYVGNYFKCRKYITGFTGSAGTAVIGKDEAYLWTDGRYFVQAAQQLDGSCVGLMRMAEPGVPTINEWLDANIPEGGNLGFDGRTISAKDGKEYEKLLSPKSVTIEYNIDLVGDVWEDRPPMSDAPAFLYDEKYSGESTASKLERIRKTMTEKGADTHILTSLDDLDWVLNIRGDDVPHAPFVLAYAIIGMDSFNYYVDESKLSDEIKKYLADNGVTLHPYNDIYKDIKSINAEASILLDPAKVNYTLFKEIPTSCNIIEDADPEVIMKAMKNPVELENTRQAHIQDGVAVTKFMYWMKNNYDKQKMTELSAQAYLQDLRKARPGFIQDNFDYICAYKEHAALMHYSSTPETDCELKEGALFLNDTGGAYYQGSTDITRTFVLGSIDDEIKKYYTAVVRGLINLSRAKFLYGCFGFNLDILARQPIWDLDKDYKCGTGHGVGHLGNVHEGPAGFRWKIVPERKEDHRLEEGMVLTIEPGVYEEGWFGTRTENEVIIHKGENNDYGQFMYFETITFAPIDLDGIDPDAMQQDEKDWLNNYHAQVYEKISPYLTDDEKSWLKEYTIAI